MRLLRGVGWSNHQVGKQDVQTGRRWWGGREAMETEVAISLHGSIREKTAQVRKYERKEDGRNHVSCYNFLIQIIINIFWIIKNNLSYSIKLLHSMQWGIFRTTWGKETSFSPTLKYFWANSSVQVCDAFHEVTCLDLTFERKFILLYYTRLVLVETDLEPSQFC